MSPINTNQTPHDWPENEQTINVHLHDLPHDSSIAESWYIDAHLEDDLKNLFFIKATLILYHQQTSFYPAMYWTVYDYTQQKYLCYSHLDQAIINILVEAFSNKELSHIEMALTESIMKGVLPPPDRLLREKTIKKNSLFLKIDNNQFEKINNEYSLIMQEENIKCHLNFSPCGKACWNGKEGIISRNNEKIFSYFFPQLSVQGTIEWDGKQLSVKGKGWLEHKFGSYFDKRIQNSHHALRVFNLQFNDNTALSIYEYYDNKNGKIFNNFSIYIENDQQFDITVYEISTLDSWTSFKTFLTYAKDWKIIIPALSLEINLHSVFPEQEIVTLLATPSFWEGEVTISGTKKGKKISGRGSVQQCLNEYYNNFDDFTEIMGQLVRKNFSKVYPLNPSLEQVRNLVADQETAYYVDDINIDVFVETVIKPVREIADRLGKGWRSFSLLACIEAVGGDSKNYEQWLIISEFMHVGSLIIDDIEDQSIIRRGKATAHLIFGVPICINAGTAAYYLFISQVINSTPLSAEKKVAIYDQYFKAMRAAHAGQALDIYGLKPLLAEVLKTGEISKLKKQLITIHRLKTGVPVACLAEIGAILGGASKEQLIAIRVFFEEIGISFQYLDDVITLRQSKKNLKQRGEDIRAGKITVPIIFALEVLKDTEKTELIDLLFSVEKKEEDIEHAIELLESYGVIDAVIKEARDRLESAWEKLDKVTPPSFSKILIRAFGLLFISHGYKT